MTPYSDVTLIILILVTCILVRSFNLASAKYRKVILVFINLFFGFILLGDHFNRVLIFCVINYFLTKQLAVRNKSIFIFYGCLLASLAPLVAFKFHAGNLGFLGISYITFRSLNVIFEVRDGILKKEDLTVKEYFLFLTFFPTIASGPIQLFRPFNKSFELPEDSDVIFRQGLARFLLGLIYKLISLAVAHHWLDQKISSWDSLNLLSNIYAYSAYLFFDFAGYSLLAIGTSLMLGFKCPDNFNLPFLSRNLKEFWNRWHISLSFWFRDFVFMRSVRLLLKSRPSLNRFTVIAVSTFVSFGLMGVWHGFERHYLAYGIYHALGLCVLEAFVFFGVNKRIVLPMFCSWLLTIHFVCFGFYIFSGKLFL